MAFHSKSKKGGSTRKAPKTPRKYLRQKVEVSDLPFIQILQWWTHRQSLEVGRIVSSEFLLPPAYKAYSKVSIEEHHVQRPNLPSVFKLKDYCPAVFMDLRRRLGVDSYDLTQSVQGGEVITVVEGSQYTTANRHYAIEIMSKEQIGLHLKLLRSYQEHIIATDGTTLLPHMIAMHRITYEDGGREKRVYLLIKRNIFASSLKMSDVFYIKGYKGHMKKSKKERKKDPLVPVPLGDADFMTLGKTMEFSREVGTSITEAMTRDTAYLMNQKLVDFTFVVGYHKYDEHSIPRINTVAACHFVEGLAVKQEHYFMAFSDFGTFFNAKKKVEHAAEEINKKKKQADTKDYMRPEHYTNRFMEFMKARMGLVDVEEEEEQVTFIDDCGEHRRSSLGDVSRVIADSVDDDTDTDASG